MSQLTDNLNQIVSIKSEIKDAIEAKGVDMTGASFPDYPEKIGEIETGGTFVTETLSVTVNNTYYPGQGVDGFSMVIVDVPIDGYTQKNLTEKEYEVSYLNNSASFVASQAFPGNMTVQSVYLPECKYVYSSAFTDCKNLSQISLPICTYIGNMGLAGTSITEITSSMFPECLVLDNYAFARCSYLSEIDFRKLKVCYDYAFQSCSKLITVNLPDCTTLNTGTFRECYSLLTVNLPNVEMLRGSVFNYCRSLTSAYLPKCSHLGGSAFNGCYSLSYAYLPNCYRIDGINAFMSCYSLLSIDLPNCMCIPDSTFYRCSLLSEVSLPECIWMGGDVFQYDSLLSELILPNCFSLSGALVNDCPGLTTVSIPMAKKFNQWFGNAVIQTSNVSVLYTCTETYGVPTYSYLVGNSTMLHRGTGSIYVNVQNYSYFVTASGWSLISSLIISVGDSTVPLVSVSDGEVYGSTKFIGSDYKNYFNIGNQTVTSINLPNCVVVDSYAFSNNTSIRSISLPTCKYIGSSAFIGDNQLGELSLPECRWIDSYAFRNCSLTNISLPKCEVISVHAFYGNKFSVISLPKCKEIGQDAFGDCRNLEYVYLPECGLIAGYAFDGCMNLHEIYLPSTAVCLTNGNILPNVGTNPRISIFVNKDLVDVYKILWSSFSQSIYMIEDDYMFSDGIVFGWGTTMDSGYLSTLNISAADVTGVSMSKLMTVASSTFMNHYNLVSIISLGFVNEYPDDLFNGTGFSEFGISVSMLGNRVFANCSGLEKVTINYDGIVNAGSNLFQNCPNLSQIGVPYDYYSDYLTAPGWSEYSSLIYREEPLLSFSNGLVFGRTTTIDSTYLQTLGITSNQVVSVSLPNCVSVGYRTFLECHSLKDVYLPNCEYLANGAFYGANYMNGIDLPKCSYIGDYAFYWCAYSMSYLKLGYSGVCTLGGGNVFTQTPSMRSIYVPASLVDEYKSAYGWSTYSTRIVPIPE